MFTSFPQPVLAMCIRRLIAWPNTWPKELPPMAPRVQRGARGKKYRTTKAREVETFPLGTPTSGTYGRQKRLFLNLSRNHQNVRTLEGHPQVDTHHAATSQLGGDPTKGPTTKTSRPPLEVPKAHLEPKLRRRSTQRRRSTRRVSQRSPRAETEGRAEGRVQPNSIQFIQSL